MAEWFANLAVRLRAHVRPEFGAWFDRLPEPGTVTGPVTEATSEDQVRAVAAALRAAGYDDAAVAASVAGLIISEVRRYGFEVTRTRRPRVKDEELTVYDLQW